MTSDANGSDLEALEQAFSEALRLKGAQREAYLDHLRNDDRELFEAVEEMLSLSESPDDRLQPGSQDRLETWKHLGVPDLAQPTESDRHTLEVEQVADFRLLEKIGEGGMATVYRGVRETEEFRQEVAVKILKGFMSHESQARFRRERRIVAGLDHPNIAKLIDGGLTEDGRPYFALELVDGSPIDVYCDEKRLGLRERVRLVVDVGRALHYAHQNLVVHRDLKPSNVFVDNSGRVRLLDFGIAKQLDAEGEGSDSTRTGSQPLTPVYSSPEQFAGDPVTTASDQYQLGLLLFELITGQNHHLLDGEDPASIVGRACRADTPRPSRMFRSRTTMTRGNRSIRDLAEVAHDRHSTLRQLVQEASGDLDWIIQRTLAKKPAERYRSTTSMVEDLERFLDRRPIRARPPSFSYLARKWIGRHQARTVLVGTLAAVSLAAWIGFSFQSRQAEAERAFSQEVERQTQQIEQLLHEAALQPLHDTTRERQSVAERMQRMQLEAEADPDLLGPAADYGLGRGYLALGDHEQAALHLRSAWEGGFRGGGIRYALGATLGELYRRDLQVINAIADPEARAARLHQAQVDLRDEALAHLRSIEDEIGERAQLRTSLIALYEGRYVEALERVRQVQEQFPWAHSARVLEGEILTARAETAFLEGHDELARSDLLQAGRALAAAGEIARSDAEVHLRECSRLTILVRVDGIEPTDAIPIEERAEDACGRASLVRPAWVEPYLELANFYIGMWDVVNDLGTEQEIGLAMRRAAEKAVDVEPANARAHHRLGLVHLFDGDVRLKLDESPESAYAEARAELLEASRLDPSYPYSFNGLSVVANELSQWQFRAGLDPSQSLLESRRNALRAIEIVPHWHNARRNLTRSSILKGSWLAATRGEPDPVLSRAFEELEPVIRAQPDSVRTSGQITQVLTLRASVRADEGGGAASLCDQIEQRATVALERNPSHTNSLVHLGAASILRAWNASPLVVSHSELEKARNLLERANETLGQVEGRSPIDGRPAHFLMELANLELRLAFARGDSTQVQWSTFTRRYEKLSAVGHFDIRSIMVLLRAERVGAATKIALGRSAQTELQAGFDRAQNTLERNPLLWAVATENAALQILFAAQDPSASHLYLQAQEALRGILVENPRVTPTVQPLLALAEQASAGSIGRRELARKLVVYAGGFPIL